MSDYLAAEFDSVASQQAWTPATQVIVLLHYIEQQESPDAFTDFLLRQVEEEEALCPRVEEE